MQLRRRFRLLSISSPVRVDVVVAATAVAVVAMVAVTTMVDVTADAIDLSEEGRVKSEELPPDGL